MKFRNNYCVMRLYQHKILNMNKLISKSERELNSKIKKSFEDTREFINHKTTVVWKNMSVNYPITEITLSTVQKTKEVV